MAQSTKVDVRSNGVRPFLSASNASVSVPQSGNTTVLEIDVTELEQIFVEVAVATKLLDAFIISGKAHRDGSYLTLYSAGADFTSPAGLLIDASGDITTQAAGSSGWFLMDVRGLVAVKLQASGGDAVASSVSVYASGQ
ncbi:MAG: hypothetical protein ACM3SS_11555 [Rhodospirillaceae bacterium]